MVFDMDKQRCLETFVVVHGLFHLNFILNFIMTYQQTRIQDESIQHGKDPYTKTMTTK
jgi:hypothetical protein